MKRMRAKKLLVLIGVFLVALAFLPIMNAIANEANIVCSQAQAVPSIELPTNANAIDTGQPAPAILNLGHLGPMDVAIIDSAIDNNTATTTANQNAATTLNNRNQQSKLATIAINLNATTRTGYRDAEIHRACVNNANTVQVANESNAINAIAAINGSSIGALEITNRALPIPINAIANTAKAFPLDGGQTNNTA